MAKLSETILPSMVGVSDGYAKMSRRVSNNIYDTNWTLRYIGNGNIKLTVWENGKGRETELIGFVEPADEFPSDHLIAQLVLVVG